MHNNRCNEIKTVIQSIYKSDPELFLTNNLDELNLENLLFNLDIEKINEFNTYFRKIASEELVEKYNIELFKNFSKIVEMVYTKK